MRYVHETLNIGGDLSTSFYLKSNLLYTLLCEQHWKL